MEYFREGCRYHVTPYPGIPKLLKELKDAGAKLGVISNKPHANTVDVIHQVFGEGVFDCVQGQQEQIARKPDPEGVYRLMEALNTTKEECLYVGDSEVDIRTGKNAGVRTVGVAWGFRDREALSAAGAETIIDEPGELTGIRI